MNIRFDFKKVQIIARRLVTLLAILFLCAPISLLNADSTTEPQTTLHKTITPISGQDDKYELSLDITSKLGTETQTDPLDVVLVADLSGSMSKRDVPSSTGRTITRLDALKNTLKGTRDRQGLIDTILSNSKIRKILRNQMGEESFKLIFSAHSIPIFALDYGDPYIDQIFDNTKLITEQLGLTADQYTNIWQSESDIGIPWIKPDVLEYLREQKQHPEHYIFVPISFISEHIEVLFDNVWNVMRYVRNWGCIAIVHLSPIRIVV